MFLLLPLRMYLFAGYFSRKRRQNQRIVYDKVDFWHRKISPLYLLAVYNTTGDRYTIHFVKNYHVYSKNSAFKQLVDIPRCWRHYILSTSQWKRRYIAFQETTELLYDQMWVKTSRNELIRNRSYLFKKQRIDDTSSNEMFPDVTLAVDLSSTNIFAPPFTLNVAII